MANFAAMLNILGIETSCDDTCAAVQVGKESVSSITSTQEAHQTYGGVIPEMASRAHQANIVHVVDKALKASEIKLSHLNAIAFTQGPGLMGALMVGHSFARTLSLALDLPLLAVNHLHGHHLSHFIEPPYPEFPFLNLLVSGGHAQIVLMHNPTQYEVLGETIDDAAGEALDKAAQMLGLPYPGGPSIDQYAQEGFPQAFYFPRSDLAGYNFSFSGLKTSLLYFLRDQLKDDPFFINNNLSDICASYQQALIDSLLFKLKAASHDYQVKTIGIAGGVAANSLLRKQLETMAYAENWEIKMPAFTYCTDNAAMINQVAYYQYYMGQFASQTVVPFSR